MMLTILLIFCVVDLMMMMIVMLIGDNLLSSSVNGSKMMLIVVVFVGNHRILCMVSYYGLGPVHIHPVLWVVVRGQNDNRTLCLSMTCRLERTCTFRVFSQHDVLFSSSVWVFVLFLFL